MKTTGPPVIGQAAAGLSRRCFLKRSAVAALAAKMAPAAALLFKNGCCPIRQPLSRDPIALDTLNGLLAFVVPGPDAYSVHQGVSTEEAGGVDANVLEVLIASLDGFQTPPAPFESISALVTCMLNDAALKVRLFASGPFASAFARLSFSDKARVFASLEGDPLTAPVAGALPTFVAFLAYSEAGVFDPQTRELTGQPVGWANSGYGGVAWGHNELKGYYEGRFEVERGT